MTFLPIVARELRLQARRPATHWTRFGAALTVLLMWLVIFLCKGRLSSAQVSHNLFVAVGVLGFTFALLAGVFLTADCLSEEKREGTLGLLFLTDLRGYDVVLGKLAANSLHAFFGLLAIFPILGLPLLIGGVTGGEFWRLILVLIATLLFSLTVGLAVSSVNREARQAMSGTFLTILFLGGLLPAIWWLRLVLYRGVWPSWLLWPSPVETFRTALAAGYASASGRTAFWSSLVTVSVVAFGALVVSAWVLPRSWHEKKVARETPVASRQDVALFHRRRGLRLKYLDSNPFLWLALRDPLSRTLTWGVVGTLAVFWSAFYVAATVSSSHKEAFIVCLFISYGLHQVYKCMLAVEATRQLSTDRASGALELLLVTPLRESEIIKGQIEALRKQFRGVQFMLLSLNVLLGWATVFWPKKLGMSTDDQTVFIELFSGGLLMLFLDSRALVRAGMSKALREKRHHRAVLKTLASVMLPPWCALFLMIIIFQALVSSAWSAGVVFACWFLVGTITCGIVFSQANFNLSLGFRYSLSDRKDLPPPPSPRFTNWAPARA